MDPLLFVGIVGSSFLGIGLLEHLDIKINHGALTFAMEIVKYGGILYVLKTVAAFFI